MGSDFSFVAVVGAVKLTVASLVVRQPAAKRTAGARGGIVGRRKAAKTTGRANVGAVWVDQKKTFKPKNRG